jgi:hypothetical protein
MSSGAGEVLADVLREEDGDMYGSRFEKDRSASEGGEGERESVESSESDASEEGNGLSGELGALFSVEKSMVNAGGARVGCSVHNNNRKGQSAVVGEVR